MKKFLIALVVSALCASGTISTYFICKYAINWPNHMIAKGRGAITSLGGEDYKGTWSLFSDGTVVVTGQEPETWLRVGSSGENSSPVPDLKPDAKRAPGGWILWESSTGRYRYEYLGGGKDTSK